MSGPPTQDSPVGISRLHPLEVLGQLIQAAVPELRNDPTVTRTRIGQQPATTPQVWPSLTILVPSGAKWQAVWGQPERIDRYTSGPKLGRDKHYEVPGSFTPSPGSVGSVVLRVGYWNGPILLQLAATADRQRARLEQAITNMFAEQRGTIVARVPSCANAWHEWMMNMGTFRDEFAFDKALFSELDVEAQHPILVELRGVSRIETLQLRFTENMLTPFDSITADQIEAFNVNSDGSISRTT